MVAKIQANHIVHKNGNSREENQMGRNIEGLKNYWKVKTDTAIAKVDEAIKTLATNSEKINFNTISKESGVSKNFLYNNDSVKSRIIQLRNQQINHEINQRAICELKPSNFGKAVFVN